MQGGVCIVCTYIQICLKLLDSATIKICFILLDLVDWIKNIIKG